MQLFIVVPVHSAASGNPELQFNNEFPEIALHASQRIRLDKARQFDNPMRL